MNSYYFFLTMKLMLLTTFKFKHRLSESKLTNSNTMYNYLQQKYYSKKSKFSLTWNPYYCRKYNKLQHFEILWNRLFFLKMRN